jgi:hypothetical protein
MSNNQQPNLMDMRRMLKNHGVTVSCARPMWIARTEQGEAIAVYEKMRDAIYYAFGVTLLRVLEEVSPNF